jgi:membrane protein DedA with SNARE-associated domain
MSFFSHAHLRHLLDSYGYGLVGLVIFLESFGLPLPGESLLIAAAIYAATTHHMAIAIVVAIASVAATVGSMAGFAVGRWIGPARLSRYGRYVGLNENRARTATRLFKRHGAKVILVARFVAFLRSLAAILAGATEMPWLRFTVANAVGAVVWSAFYGVGAYWLGAEAERLATPAAIGLGCVAAVVVVVSIVLVRRQERSLLQSGET